MNLFATVLTYPAPSANYRGESELNRTVIQKVTDGRFDYAIISPEAMRNALRETLAEYRLPCNRSRIEPRAGAAAGEGEKEEKQQLAVKFIDFPNPDKFVDDFFFGYLLAVKGETLKKIREARGKDFPLKRDSVLRMNLAKALEPYRHDAVFTQSPQVKESPWTVTDERAQSALLHRETAVTAFQYPFALNLNDCTASTGSAKSAELEKKKKVWTKKLLQAIGELNGVAGNHARSYFEMAPASIVVRVTSLLVAGYETYGFKASGKAGEYGFPEVIDGILNAPPDYPGNEFFIGGKIVKDMEIEDQQVKKQQERKEQGKKERPGDQAEADGGSLKGRVERLRESGVTFDRDPRRLLETVANRFLGGE